MQDKNQEISAQNAAEIKKKKIIDLIGQIQDESVLTKIYTVVKTHLEILKEKGD